MGLDQLVVRRARTHSAASIVQTDGGGGAFNFSGDAFLLQALGVAHCPGHHTDPRESSPSVPYCAELLATHGFFDGRLEKSRRRAFIPQKPFFFFGKLTEQGAVTLPSHSEKQNTRTLQSPDREQFLYYPADPSHSKWFPNASHGRDKPPGILRAKQAPGNFIQTEAWPGQLSWIV